MFECVSNVCRGATRLCMKLTVRTATVRSQKTGKSIKVQYVKRAFQTRMDVPSADSALVNVL